MCGQFVVDILYSWMGQCLSVSNCPNRETKSNQVGKNLQDYERKDLWFALYEETDWKSENFLEGCSMDMSRIFNRATSFLQNSSPL
ncbi:hypothetical protein VNO77_27180 [Canavalia gladiata]|uniref:Uncharacterized protein n=1 Tax=Canavalia gladiata TaxID=3824 RepID=A0AAN9KWH0_CANGL